MQGAAHHFLPMRCVAMGSGLDLCTLTQACLPFLKIRNRCFSEFTSCHCK